jgi:FkbM family methyltransferase
MLLSFALAYSRHAPFSRGKWRVHRFIDQRLGRSSETIRTRDGLQMQLDTDEFLQRTIYITGEWDEHVAAEVRALGPGDLFVDVGANIGYFSLLAASRGAEVIAFEPNPACHEALLRNAKLNGLTIDARQIALTDRPGRGTLVIERDDRLGAAHLGEAGAGRITVPLDTLDLQLGGRQPKLLKIDVEGAEIGVLEGASETLTVGTRVIIEVSEYSLIRFGGSKDQLFALLSRNGYKGRLLNQPVQSNATDDAIYFQYDALFARPPV